MTSGNWQVRFGRSPHLVDLIAEVERLAERVRDRRPAVEPEAVERLRADAAVASLRLDGSRIEEPPSELRDTDSPRAPAPAQQRRTGTWLDAMAARLDDASDEQITNREFLGVLAALASDDLCDQLSARPLETWAELHRRLTAGLLPVDQAGQPRVTDQAVHDASIGRIIYFPADPAEIPSRLNLLSGWLQTVGAREHGVVASGVLHYELLHIHPYEAANGRLARAAARLTLRSRGLDPEGVALPEVVLARDPIGYYSEVARTVRRRDLTIWLERWGEAVAGGLREAAQRLGVEMPDDPPDRARQFVASWDQPRFTIADYRAAVSVGPEDARGDLRELLDAGHIRRVPGSRGLRFEKPLRQE